MTGEMGIESAAMQANEACLHSVLSTGQEVFKRRSKTHFAVSTTAFTNIGGNSPFQRMCVRLPVRIDEGGVYTAMYGSGRSFTRNLTARLRE